MTETVNLYDAKTNLSKLFPYEALHKKRIGGQNLLGITYIADDFDGPLPPDIQRYFDGEGDADLA